MGLIAISLGLLAVVAGMFLLAKTKKEALGSFFKYVSYLVIFIGFLAVACAFSQGVCRMWCRSKQCSYDSRSAAACPMKMENGEGMEKGEHKMGKCCKMGEKAGEQRQDTSSSE